MSNDRIDEAVTYFKSDYNCCQSIIMAYGPQFGLSKETGIRLSTGFGGGMARQGEVCGAVTGVIMIIGLKHSMEDDEDAHAGDNTHALVAEFMDRFKEKNSSVKCNELLGCDIGTPGGREEAKEKDLFNPLCPKLVRSSAEILKDII